MPFLVKALFDAPHPDSWITITMPEPDGPRPLVLFRTEEPSVFQSDWLAVAEDEDAR